MKRGDRRKTRDGGETNLEIGWRMEAPGSLWYLSESRTRPIQVEVHWEE